VIEQITYLLFIRRLDDLHTLEENKANRLKKPMERRVLPEGNDAKKRPYEDLRWTRFKHFAPADMYTVVGEHLFIRSSDEGRSVPPSADRPASMWVSRTSPGQSAERRWTNSADLGGTG
jgi:hypothetical protein